MFKHLKPRQEYVDCYDRITVEDCRWQENFHKNYDYGVPDGVDKKNTKGIHDAMAEMCIHYDLLFTTLYWWEHKESTIQEWMDKDAKDDLLLENAKAPASVRCLKCSNELTVESKTIYDFGGHGNRVLFFYRCSNKCNPNRAFFDNGEEYLPKRDNCQKCKIELKRTYDKTNKDKIITTDTCPSCGQIKTSELDLTVKEWKPDADYARDRERFCLTEAEAQKKLEEKLQLENIKRIVDGWKEKDKKKKEYDIITKLKKLTIPDLEKYLVPLLEKDGYAKLQFGNPDMNKNVFLPFTIRDEKSDRTDQASTFTIQKVIKKVLENTNWRLMSDGILYRLGILSGRLHAYEKGEDLLRLVSKTEVDTETNT